MSSSQDAPRPDDPAPRGSVSRRSLIIAGASVAAAVAVGVAVPVLGGIQRRPGTLVSQMLAKQTFSVAHRGGSDDWPEMSLLAYQNAVNIGVDALEVSLARTSDGIWFGLHDRTLDRTSGTTGFVASEHTWAEIVQHRISASGTHDRAQPTQPYMRFQELIEAFAPTHAIFVDPKYVGAEHFHELFTAMGKIVDLPRQTFIAKSFHSSTEWAMDARARGFKTWGYYYASEFEADPSLFTKTQRSWDILGLDYQGSPAAWKAVRDFGKPVIAHTIPERRAADVAEGLGARGLMISGVHEVLAG